MLSTTKGSVPLYMQIKELLIAKISGGEWAAGGMIPSEMQLASELEVSQGTVRKAITDLVENNVLTRKQGRGTFVANHDAKRALFHFFHITDDNGNPLLPDSITLSCQRRRAKSTEATRLNLSKGATVIHIERVRTFEGRPILLDTVILPAALFGNLGKPDAGNLPNLLYELYEKQFGITVHRAEEQLRAIVVTEENALLLNLPVGAPLLEIERVALTLDNTPVELRVSRINTQEYRYHNTLV